MWKPADDPREGEVRYRHYRQITFVTREAWLDFGWWALWPIHFCRHTPTQWESDVYDYENDRPRYDRLYWSSAWTGRPSEICAVVLFNRWLVRLP